MIRWQDRAWDDYVSWQGRDPKTLDRINKILRDLRRSPFDGIGKPELLKGDLRGCWSRRIDGANRLVYCVIDGDIEIMSCKGHYGEK